MKKILLAMVTLSVLMFALSGCGVFSQPELGTVWNAKGAAEITAEHDPLTVRDYSLDIKLEFGDIWDSNKVKMGTITFGAATSDERIDVSDPKYTVLDGHYNPADKELRLNCEETTKKTKITLLGRVVNKETIEIGTIYKKANLTESIGSFTAEKQ